MSRSPEESGEGEPVEANRDGLAARRRWLGLLAKTDETRLEAVWAKLHDKPGYDFLRRPDIGLVMVRGRAGGTGRLFNLGEMTATRCAVRLDTGTIGLGYVTGRKPRHAELIALFDALLQDPKRRTDFESSLLAPIESDLAARRAASSAKTAGTKVDFFTMARGT